MFLNDDPTSVAVKPAPGAATGAQGYMNTALPGSGSQPTRVRAHLINTLMDELLNVVAYAGLAPDKANDAQLLAAMLSIIDGAGAAGGNPLSGLTLANAPGFTTTRIACTAGICRDSTNTARITLAAPMTKRLDAVWAAGNNNGGRLTAGALSNGQTYHCFAIYNPTTGAVEAPVFDTSPTAPNLPGGFTKFRWLGPIMLDAAATTITPFTQDGDDFMFVTPRADFAAQANGSGVPTLRQFSLPNGVKSVAYLNLASTGTVDNNAYYSGMFDPDQGVPAAWGLSTQRAQIRRLSFTSPSAGNVTYGYQEFTEKSDTSGRLYTFSSDASDVIAVKTRGYRINRSRFVPV